jgi:hypothetical protein
MSVCPKGAVRIVAMGTGDQFHVKADLAILTDDDGAGLNEDPMVEEGPSAYHHVPAREDHTMSDFRGLDIHASDPVDNDAYDPRGEDAAGKGIEQEMPKGYAEVVANRADRLYRIFAIAAKHQPTRREIGRSIVEWLLKGTNLI